MNFGFLSTIQKLIRLTKSYSNVDLSPSWTYQIVITNFNIDKFYDCVPVEWSSVKSLIFIGTPVK